MRKIVLNYKDNEIDPQRLGQYKDIGDDKFLTLITNERGLVLAENYHETFRGAIVDLEKTKEKNRLVVTFHTANTGLLKDPKWVVSHEVLGMEYFTPNKTQKLF